MAKTYEQRLASQREANRRWIAKNPDLKRKLTRQSMQQIRTTPDGLTKNRTNSKKYRSRYLATDPDGYKLKHRNHKLKTKYGITVEQWEIIFNRQNRCCAICRSPEPRWKRGHWHTDHDHELNVVRGILCNECNIGLGKFKDNPDLLQLAIDYVKGAGRDRQDV